MKDYENINKDYYNPRTNESNLLSEDSFNKKTKQSFLIKLTFITVLIFSFYYLIKNITCIDGYAPDLHLTKGNPQLALQYLFNGCYRDSYMTFPSEVDEDSEYYSHQKVSEFMFYEFFLPNTNINKGSKRLFIRIPDFPPSSKKPNFQTPLPEKLKQEIYRTIELTTKGQIPDDEKLNNTAMHCYKLCMGYEDSENKYVSCLIKHVDFIVKQGNTDAIKRLASKLKKIYPKRFSRANSAKIIDITNSTYSLVKNQFKKKSELFPKHTENQHNTLSKDKQVPLSENKIVKHTNNENITNKIANNSLKSNIVKKDQSFAERNKEEYEKKYIPEGKAILKELEQNERIKPYIRYKIALTMGPTDFFKGNHKSLWAALTDYFENELKIDRKDIQKFCRNKLKELGENYYNAKDYKSAYECLTSALICDKYDPRIRVCLEHLANKPIEKGSIVLFGHYEQDKNLENGPEPIEWIVIDVQNNKALLLSKYILTDIKTNDPINKTDIEEWEYCDARKWLNNDFYNSSFDKEEKSRICKIELSSDNYFNRSISNKLENEKINYLESSDSIFDYVTVPSIEDLHYLDNEYSLAAYGTPNSNISVYLNFTKLYPDDVQKYFELSEKLFRPHMRPGYKEENTVDKESLLEDYKNYSSKFRESRFYTSGEYMLRTTVKDFSNNLKNKFESIGRAGDKKNLKFNNSYVLRPEILITINNESTSSKTENMLKSNPNIPNPISELESLTNRELQEGLLYPTSSNNFDSKIDITSYKNISNFFKKNNIDDKFIFKFCRNQLKNRGSKRINKGDHLNAYKCLFFTQLYEEWTPNLLNLAKAAADIPNKIGNVVLLGHYEQDGNPKNGPEPIEWIIIDAEEDKILLLSAYVLEQKALTTQKENYKWENTELRHWLNNEFLNTAFSQEERNKLLPIELNENDLNIRSLKSRPINFDDNEYYYREIKGIKDYKAPKGVIDLVSLPDYQDLEKIRNTIPLASLLVPNQNQIQTLRNSIYYSISPEMRKSLYNRPTDKNEFKIWGRSGYWHRRSDDIKRNKRNIEKNITMQITNEDGYTRSLISSQKYGVRPMIMIKSNNPLPKIEKQMDKFNSFFNAIDTFEKNYKKIKNLEKLSNNFNQLSSDD